MERPENEVPELVSEAQIDSMKLQPHKEPDWFNEAWKRYLQSVSDLHLEDPRRLPSPESMRRRTDI